MCAPSAALAEAPGATTGDATNVTSTTATLNGVVNPNKEDTTWYFEFGTTTAYGIKTTPAVEGGNAGKAVTFNITSLQPNTTYHFRLVATNASGTDVGADRVFTTGPSPYAIPQHSLSITRTPTIVVFGRSSVISGVLSGPNCANVQVQLFANPFPYTAGFKPQGNPINTDAACRYTFTVFPALHTRYSVQAKTKPDVASPIVEIRVRTRVSFSVSDRTANRGQLIRFRGTVAPAHTGLRVRIQRRTSRGYRTIARPLLRAATNNRSSYSRRIRVYRRGTYRVVMPGHNDHLQGTSARRTIRMN